MKNIILKNNVGTLESDLLLRGETRRGKEKKTMAVCVKVGDNRCVIEGIIFSSSSWYDGAVSWNRQNLKSHVAQSSPDPSKLMSDSYHQ